MNRGPPNGESSFPPPRLSDPHASQNSRSDRRTPVDTLGFYEMMGYDNVQSPVSTLEKQQEEIKRKSTQSLIRKEEFLRKVNADGTRVSMSPPARSPFSQQIHGERASVSPVLPVRGTTKPEDPYGYMDMIGYGANDPPLPVNSQKPPAGQFNVPGYPQQKIYSEQQSSPPPVRYEAPEIPSLNQPIMPELDHRKFDPGDALETVPPFNPKWVDPQPLFDWLMPPKAPRKLDRPTLPGQSKAATNAKGKAGVGLAVSPNKEGEWVVSSVHPNGPAAQTGMIDPGDTIKACNGVVLKGYPRQSVIDAMTGPPATQAVMLVEKAKTRNVITVFVSREMLGTEEVSEVDEDDGLYAHQRYDEREETEEERDLRLELENVELRKRLAKLKGQMPEKDNSMMAKIQSWGWDMTTLTKKPANYIEEELPVLNLPASLEPVGFLDVEVIQARNIPRVDILGSADPAAAVLEGGCLSRTAAAVVSSDLMGCGSGKSTIWQGAWYAMPSTDTVHGVQKNTLNPHWGEILAVNIFDPRQTLRLHKLKIPDQMQVQLCSWKSAGKDEFIGTVLFSAGELCGGLDEKGVGEGWYDVQKERKTGGMEAVTSTHSKSPCQLYLRFTYTMVPMEVRNTLGATPSLAPV